MKSITKSDIHDVAVEIIGDTAIFWSRITLEAVVRDNEVSNEFTGIEVYVMENGSWKLLTLSFTRLMN